VAIFRHPKSRYRELAKQYHPDRYEGLAPEFKEAAKKKMQEINAAYTRSSSFFLLQ
jgi:curved DNA-binding protein CbpA